MSILDYYSASDSVILEELGSRLRKLRVSQNKTQEQLAERIGKSRGAIQNLESGNGKLSNLIAVLRDLGALEQLDQLIPHVEYSPLNSIDTGADPTERKRAYKKRRNMGGHDGED